MPNEKRFAFVEQQYSGVIHRRRGPHYSQWCNALNTKGKPIDTMSFTLDEILGLEGISVTNQKKISTVKEGGVVRLFKLSSTSDLGIYRLFEREINEDQTVEQLREDIRSTREEINKCIPKDLKERLAELEKQLRNLKKD